MNLDVCATHGDMFTLEDFEFIYKTLQLGYCVIDMQYMNIK